MHFLKVIQAKFGVAAFIVAASTSFSTLGEASEPDPATDPESEIVDEQIVNVNVESTLGDYLAGNFALDSGNIKDAATYFERALADDPENLELRRQVFLLDLADARYDAALKEARNLKNLQVEETNEDAQLLLTLEKVAIGDYASVPDELSGIGTQGIAALAAPFVSAWSLLGAMGTGALDEAVSLLHDGESLGALNTFHEAMLLAFSNRDADALGKLEEIIPETGPAPIRVARAHASLLAREGRTDDALAFLEAQLDLREQPVLRRAFLDIQGGGSSDLPFVDEPGGIADALLGIAEALQQERGSARAILYSRLALFVRQDLVDAQLLLGDILASQDNLDAAIESYDSIPANSPLGYAAGVRKAQVLHRAGQSRTSFWTA